MFFSHTSCRVVVVVAIVVVIVAVVVIVVVVVVVFVVVDVVVQAHAFIFRTRNGRSAVTEWKIKQFHKSDSSCIVQDIIYDYYHSILLIYYRAYYMQSKF